MLLRSPDSQNTIMTGAVDLCSMMPIMPAYRLKFIAAFGFKRLEELSSQSSFVDYGFWLMQLLGRFKLAI